MTWRVLHTLEVMGTISAGGFTRVALLAEQNNAAVPARPGAAPPPAARPATAPRANAPR